MDNRFKEFKLGEITEITAGGDKPKNFSENKTDENNVPVYANAVKDNGLYGFTDCPKILKSAVTVSARGSNVGFVAIRKEPFYPIVRLLTLIPSANKLDVDFLYYNLKQNRHSGTGSGQPQITVPNISNRSITIPSILVQKQIAKVLSDLDAKIEVNNKINQELEAMAKTLYDYWFVQFDFPDANGKPYKSSGGKMVYNEALKREIPEGWEDGKLEDLSTRIGDGLHGTPKYVDDSEYSFINGNNLKNGFISTDNETKKVSDEEYKKHFIELNSHSILLSINGTLGNLAIYNDEKVMLGKSSAYINCKENYRSYCYEYLNQNHMPKVFWNIATGSTIKNLGITSIKNLKILKPATDLILKFEDITMKIVDKRKNIFNENQKLSELRDWLLPMLMNGQVTVASLRGHEPALSEVEVKQSYNVNTKSELGMVAEEKETYSKG